MSWSWYWQLLCVAVGAVWIAWFVFVVWVCHRGFWDRPLVTNLPPMSLEEGVFQHAAGGWYVQVVWHGLVLYLGTFDTKAEAMESRDAFMALNA